MKAPRSDSNYEPMPSGNHLARLYQIIYIGTIPVEWQGATKFQYKVRIGFEFPNETKVFNEEKGEQPYVLSNEYTLSMSPKGKLRPMIESWLGKKLTDSEAADFDLDELLGKEAMVNVVHKEGNDGNTYANIATVGPLMKGSECPAPVNPPIIFGYGKDWDQRFFESLPDFIKTKITSSREYGEMMSRTQSPSTEDKRVDPEEASLQSSIDEIPF